MLAGSVKPAHPQLLTYLYFRIIHFAAYGWAVWGAPSYFKLSHKRVMKGLAPAESQVSLIILNDKINTRFSLRPHLIVNISLNVFA